MVEYNPFSEAVMRDPYPVYKQLRDEAPCYYVKEYDCWAISRFEDIWNASMDAHNYSTEQGTTSGHLLTKVQPVTPMLNLMDPPRHTQLRSQIKDFFMPKRVNKIAEQVRGFVAEALAEIRGRGEADLMFDFASKVSVKTACVATGIPLEDSDHLNALVWRFFAREEGVTGMTPDGLAAAEELGAYFMQLIAARRKAGAGRETPLDTFLVAEVDGEKLPDEAIASHLSMLIIGGAETFPKVFANGIYRLHQHPDQRAELVAHPADIPDAFIEILRYDMPTQFLGRMLLHDVELHGQTLRKGQPVLFLYPSANRDHREFPNPDVFDLKRRPPRILSFGHGIHSCIGLHFAKLEGRLCFETILAHMPEYEIQEDRLERLRTEFVQGFAGMPVRFKPF